MTTTPGTPGSVANAPIKVGEVPVLPWIIVLSGFDDGLSSAVK